MRNFCAKADTRPGILYITVQNSPNTTGCLRGWVLSEKIAVSRKPSKEEEEQRGKGGGREGEREHQNMKTRLILTGQRAEKPTRLCTSSYLWLA